MKYSILNWALATLGTLTGCSTGHSFYLPPPPAALDPVKTLSSPPVEGSEAYKADFKALLDAQKARTPQDCARANAEVQLSVEDYAAVLPPCFRPTVRPRLDELFKRIDHDERPYISAAKRNWGRPRPYVTMAALQPCVPREESTAYPSGHSTRAMLYATVLADMEPARREALLSRAREIAQDRVIGGVHHPSDIEAGKKLGASLGRAFLANAKFKKDLAELKALCDAP